MRPQLIRSRAREMWGFIQPYRLTHVVPAIWNTMRRALRDCCDRQLPRRLPLTLQRRTASRATAARAVAVAVTTVISILFHHLFTTKWQRCIRTRYRPETMDTTLPKLWCLTTIDTQLAWTATIRMLRRRQYCRSLIRLPYGYHKLQ